MKRILFLAFGFAALGLSAETAVFKETSEGRTVENRIIREIRMDGEKRIIRTEERGVVSERTINPDFTGVALQIQSNHGALNFKKTSAGVEFSGQRDGKAKKGTIDTKGLPWYADFEDASAALVKQGKKSVSFLSTGEDGDAMEMELKIEGKDTVGGRPALKLRVGLTGMMALLWSGYFWCDSEGAIVKYAMNHGPGTPDTVSELVRRE